MTTRPTKKVKVAKMSVFEDKTDNEAEMRSTGKTISGVPATDITADEAAQYDRQIRLWGM
jgi:hypothetical protein